MLDRLTLDQLRVLVAVAETGSFSAAARRLGRVQSAISQTVQTLESTLGVPLFDRSSKVPVLNDAGRVILADARNLIRGADTLKARAESIAEAVEPELTLAVEATFPNDLLMASLKGLIAVFPRLPVTVFTEGLGGAEIIGRLDLFQNLRPQRIELLVGGERVLGDALGHRDVGFLVAHLAQVIGRHCAPR
jgi:DNA-binding transcriptional LysR family regulator